LSGIIHKKAPGRKLTFVIIMSTMGIALLTLNKSGKGQKAHPGSGCQNYL
jgi:hypothetical protein